MIVVENVTKEGFARKSLSFETFECFGQYLYFITITWSKSVNNHRFLR